jgi:hypothetical protein
VACSILPHHVNDYSVMIELQVLNRFVDSPITYTALSEISA